MRNYKKTTEKWLVYRYWPTDEPPYAGVIRRRSGLYVGGPLRWRKEVKRLAKTLGIYRLWWRRGSRIKYKVVRPKKNWRELLECFAILKVDKLGRMLR